MARAIIVQAAPKSGSHTGKEVLSMAAPKVDSLLYRRSLSHPMSELLADPFSALTRARQTWLLIASTLTLLLSAGIAQVGELTIANVKLTATTPRLATGLAVAVTAYLLVTYLLGVRADWAIAKAKQWSPLASIAEVKTAMISDQEVRAQAATKRSQELERLQIEKEKIKAEMEARFKKIRDRGSEVESAISSVDIHSASSEQLSQVRLLSHEATVLAREDLATQLESNNRLRPLDNAIGELIQSISLEPTRLMFAESADIEKTVETFSNLTRLRLVIEILFPAAFAVLALTWAAMSR
jgi:hypothetical protein